MLVYAVSLYVETYSTCVQSGKIQTGAHCPQNQYDLHLITAFSNTTCRTISWEFGTVYIRCRRSPYKQIQCPLWKAWEHFLCSVLNLFLSQAWNAGLLAKSVDGAYLLPTSVSAICNDWKRTPNQWHSTVTVDKWESRNVLPNSSLSFFFFFFQMTSVFSGALSCTNTTRNFKCVVDLSFFVGLGWSGVVLAQRCGTLPSVAWASQVTHFTFVMKNTQKKTNKQACSRYFSLFSSSNVPYELLVRISTFKLGCPVYQRLCHC